MLDNKLLRNNLQAVQEALLVKGFELDVNKFNEIEQKRKALQEEVEALQQQRNTKSKSIGQAKAAGEDVSEIMSEVSKISQYLKEKDQELSALRKTQQDFLATIPNTPDASVPPGKSDADNVEIRKVGEPTKFDFEPKDHVTLGENLGLIDFATAAKLSGSRFVVLHGAMAKLQRALIQFMLDIHTKEHGYQETYVPYLVNQDSLFGTGQLPKFHEDQFNIDSEQGLSLIPTAEVPLTNMLRDEIVTLDKLPLKFTAHTPCFRSEAGSYGKDTRGMFRQHQFEKVELVMIVHPEQSEQLHEELTSHAEAILQRLEIPYRVVNLCGGDLGFSATKTYDLEVWLPGQQAYREVSSCSNFKDFQARRMQARWRNPETGKPELVHTLNGSGLALSRTMIAVIENYQDADGRIHIPDALRPYMNNMSVIE